MPGLEHGRQWNVLLVGGNSGSGKTTVARELSRGFDVPWLQVDDFRLVLEHCIGTETRPELHHFDDLSTVYRNSPETLLEWRIEAAQATSRAIEVVVANHASFGGPAILEGDDILPPLATKRTYAGVNVDERDVTAVFLIEDDEAAVDDNMRSRGRDFLSRTSSEQWNHVRMSVLYGEWLRQGAEHFNLPVLRPRPWTTLTERVLRVIQ